MLVEGIVELLKRFSQTEACDVWGEIVLKQGVLDYYDQLVPPYTGESLNIRKGMELLREHHRSLLLKRLHQEYIASGNLSVDPKEIVKRFLTEDLRETSTPGVE